MKRTHDMMVAEDNAKVKAIVFDDPVSLEPVTEPLVLTRCGHTIDGGTASDLFKNDQYICPVCRTVSKDIIPNWALATLLGLKVEWKKPGDNTDVLRLALDEDKAAADEAALACDTTIQRLLAAHIQENKGLPWNNGQYATDRPGLEIRLSEHPCFNHPRKVKLWREHRIQNKTHLQRFLDTYRFHFNEFVMIDRNNITNFTLRNVAETWNRAIMCIQYYRA